MNQTIPKMIAPTISHIGEVIASQIAAVPAKAKTERSAFTAFVAVPPASKSASSTVGAG